MQQKILKLLAILMLLLIPKVNAECSYKEQAELNKEVANIKTNYEITTTQILGAGADSGDVSVFDVDIFKINILNLSDKFYIKYSNNYNNDTKTYYPSDATNGVISFNWEDLSKVTTMTFRVYSSNKTGCANELYRTIYLTIPRYNQYHDWGICSGREDISLCDEYVTTNEISYEEFVDRLTSDIIENTDTKKGTNTSSVVSNGNLYLYILSGIAIVVVISITIILINRKRNRL